MMRQFILYACPLGPLARRLVGYRDAVERRCGRNRAHEYPPHCTLTGFFRDRAGSEAFYLRELGATLEDVRAADLPLEVRVESMQLLSGFHFLLLRSRALREIAVRFARTAESATRVGPIYSKSWLHLSLAYGYVSEHEEPLRELALALLDPGVDVGWELVLYERSGCGFVQHGSRALT